MAVINSLRRLARTTQVNLQSRYPALLPNACLARGSSPQRHQRLRETQLGFFAHGFTYSGHPVSCAVAIEALKIYKERNIPEHVNRVSTGFQEGLKAFSTSPIIGEIRGTGLILATEFTENKSAHEPFPPEWGVGEYFAAECKKHGMIVRVAGDLIMMCPPLIISPEEINELITIYGKALKATEERVKELKTQQKK